MDQLSAENAAIGGGLKTDMSKLRRLLMHGNKSAAPSWWDKPDSHVPSLEQSTPRSLILNTSMDTMYDDGSPVLAPSNESPCHSESSFDPVHAMIDLFSPSPKNVELATHPRNPAGLELCTSEDSEREKDENPDSVFEPSSLDESFDPFREIRNLLTPHSNNSKERHDAKMITPASDQLRQIASFFSPFNSKSTQDDDAKNNSPGRMVPDEDGNRTPDRLLQDEDACEVQDHLLRGEDRSETPDRLLQAFYHLKHQSPAKRSRHFEEVVDTTNYVIGPGGRQVATFCELCRDVRIGMAQLAATAKERSSAEWLAMIRDLDMHEWAKRTSLRTKRTIKEVVDSAKEFDSLAVMNTAKASARQAAKAACRSVYVNPFSWAIIGAVTCAIFVHVLFFNKSVGTPAHLYWHFTMNVHESASVRLSSRIVDRVGDALHLQIGEDGKDFMQEVRATSTCPAESGEEILLRISAALRNIEPKPDLFGVMHQRLDDIRQNPRLVLSILADAWKMGRHHLAGEAFDATVL